MTEILASLLINTLLRKGFVRVETHHTMLWFTVQGRRTSIHTWSAMGRRNWMIGCCDSSPKSFIFPGRSC